MFKRPFQYFLFFSLLFSITQNGYGQNNSSKKYQGLLWEISGNGLEKPSYLFGTMHVSNKMVFHLADSFYHALQSVHTVAIELNPENWQRGMSEMDLFQKNYANFSSESMNNFLTTKSFQLSGFEEEFKHALRSEPAVVNSLLYRSYDSKEDFEEDTFLDLYIYQTAKRAGKVTTGVEDFLETEKIVLQGYIDMVNEKKKIVDTGNDTYSDIERKTEEAYRKGDLDLLDSLQNILIGSEAFRNQFLIKRNEIQAFSIDTLLKKNTVFVGVGAAHLPGDMGVIEILRRMGYRLRPVKMITKTNFQPNEIDKKKVPVVFNKFFASDSLYSVNVPGELYSLSNDQTSLKRQQYADMSNGAYYTVTRIQTYHRFSGKSEDQVLAKLDSMLYENIPGKIISRKMILKNDFQGLDIFNRTRQGNLQRYQIWITPFEILIFKMSGKEDYVDGVEAALFFKSIDINSFAANQSFFTPKQGGFKIMFPSTSHLFLNDQMTDEIPRMEFSSTDKSTGNSYLVMKKTVTNFQFLEDDRFDLDLILESFNTTPFVARTFDKKYGKFKDMPFLEAGVKLIDSSIAKARVILDGAHYYLLLAKGNLKKDAFSTFFSSFEIVPYVYKEPNLIIDSFLNYQVTTTGIPELDAGVIFGTGFAPFRGGPIQYIR
ncbi:MAG: TraB/GumN family protein, partial [Ginsengibacter sp.]